MIFFFFSIYLRLQAALRHGVHSASNINEYQMQKINVSGSRAWPVRRADDLTAVCEPIVYTMCNPQHLFMEDGVCFL
jgi:hypothetical protein